MIRLCSSRIPERCGSNDVEISRLRGHALNEVRKRFAMLFQGAALFDSLTVFENVAFLSVRNSA
jgi:ABC-type transport system involved in resistance to organic solvents, ATPase component